LSLEIRTGDESGVYVLEGELDLVTARDLDEAVSRDGQRELVLDIENLTFIDSSGLRTLIRLAHERPDDNPLVLRRPSSSAKRLLDIAFGDGGVPGMRIAS
jgi:anti-anti-sigma factor